MDLVFIAVFLRYRRVIFLCKIRCGFFVAYHNYQSSKDLHNIVSSCIINHHHHHRLSSRISRCLIVLVQFVVHSRTYDLPPPGSSSTSEYVRVNAKIGGELEFFENSKLLSSKDYSIIISLLGKIQIVFTSTISSLSF